MFCFGVWGQGRTFLGLGDSYFMKALGQGRLCKTNWPKIKSRLTFQKGLSLQRKTKDVSKSFIRTIRSFYLHFQCNFLEYDNSVKYKNKTFMDQKKN